MEVTVSYKMVIVAVTHSSFKILFRWRMVRWVVKWILQNNAGKINAIKKK